MEVPIVKKVVKMFKPFMVFPEEIISYTFRGCLKFKMMVMV